MIKIKKELGEDGPIACKAILTILFNEMLDFFNVGKSMDQRQVAVTINLILEDYSQLKPDDFKLCFKRAMRGQYGKIYDRIDGELIFEWLEQFIYDKEQEIESYRRNENIRLKKDADFSFDTEAIQMPEEVKELIKTKIEFKSPVRPRIISPEQVTMNGYINQFDRLYLKNPAKSAITGRELPGRFVKKYGRVLNVSEYLECKVLQSVRVNEYLRKRRK